MVKQIVAFLLLCCMKFCMYNYLHFSAKAGGKPERVPYSSLKSGEAVVTVEGLPKDITFKDPSDYSKTQLKEILSNSKKITMR